MTLVFPYYDMPLMLEKQLEEWEKYPEEVNIILVDDGSPNYSSWGSNLGEFYSNLSIYRIKEDIYQNTFGARNLGFKMAEDGWVFNTDLDHVIPADSIKRLLKIVNGEEEAQKMYPDHYYKVNRYSMLNMNGQFLLKNVHGDTFIIKKKLYWELGGYDERLTGYRNGAAHKFRCQLKKIRSRLLEGVWTEWYSPDLITDASPVHERNMKPGIREGKKTLNFTYEQVI